MFNTHLDWISDYIGNQPKLTQYGSHILAANDIFFYDLFLMQEYLKDGPDEMDKLEYFKKKIWLNKNLDYVHREYVTVTSEKQAWVDVVQWRAM